MAITTHTTSATPAAGFTQPIGDRISWGAILAGVSLMFALSWLLLLLGTAIGVGVADATDLGAMGDGLGIGAIIWILLSMIVATLAGGILAAVLSGTINDRIGALHGLSVWSVGILITIVLGASGIGGAVNAIGGAMSSANDVSTTVINKVSGGDDSSMLPDSVSTTISAVMKRQASKLVSQASSSTSKSDVRSAISELDAQDAGAITSALVSGDLDKARDELTSRTDLSDSEINSIVDNAEDKAQSWSNSQDAQEAQAWLKEQYSSAKRAVSQSVSELAGSQTNAQEISTAIEQLDSETLMEAGRYLVMGKPQMAKDVLAVNTTLSEKDINAVVDGAEKETKQMISKVKAELNEASETVATYTQAVIWSAFIAAALGLIAGLIGGHIGSGAVRRVYAVRS